MNRLGSVLILLVTFSALLPKPVFSDYTLTPVPRCPGDAGKGFDDIDFIRNYLDPSSTNDLWDKCWKAYEAGQICSKTCDDGYYASAYEADMAYVDYLRTYLDTHDDIDWLLNSSNPNYMSDAEFSQFIRDIKPAVFDINCFGPAVADGSSAQCEQIRQPGFTCNGGSGGSDDAKATYDLFKIQVPESFYKQYVGTVVFNYNIECENGDDSDVMFITNTYLPRYQNAVTDINSELDNIKKVREQNANNPPQNGGPQEPQGGGSASINMPQGDVVIPAASTDSSKVKNDLNPGLSAGDVNAVAQNTKSYHADLPDTPGGKEINVDFPGNSDVSKIAAKTTTSISNVSMDVDIIDLHKSPQLLRQPDPFYDTYNPNNPLIPPPNVPTVEVIALKMYQNPNNGAYGTPVTTPTGIPETGGLSAENTMNDYYFEFRLPSDVMEAARAGQDVHTGSKDLYIKTESDLQHVELRHYNYVTQTWDKLPTKSVGKCDLQMCVFVAGPTTGRSYYAIVVDNETSSSQFQIPGIPNLTCCGSPAMIILILAFAVMRSETATD